MMGVRQFVFRWVATTVAVMVSSSIIRGIRYDTVAALIGASLLLGILNAFVRPFLLILSAPVILLTLGLFILVLNGLLLLLVPSVVVGFHVHSFWSAFWGAIVISIVSWLLSALFRGSDGRVHVLTHHSEVRPVRGRVLEDEQRR
jgi:putative membrane protein